MGKVQRFHFGDRWTLGGNGAGMKIFRDEVVEYRFRIQRQNLRSTTFIENRALTWPSTTISTNVRINKFYKMSKVIKPTLASKVKRIKSKETALSADEVS